MRIHSVFDSKENFKIEKEKLLLVEGKDDGNLCIPFLKKLSLNDDIQICDYGGKDRLYKVLKLLPNAPDYKLIKSIGITRDADDKKGSEVFKDIQNILRNINLPIPSSIGKFIGGSPKMGVYIFPDCEDTGELEDLCFASISAKNEIGCVNEFIRCSEKINPLKKKGKAQLCAWLSIQKGSTLRLGEAANAGLFDFNNPCFRKLTDFIKNL